MTQHLNTTGVMMELLGMSGNFAIDEATTTGLTLGLFSGVYVTANVVQTIAATTEVLADDATNWVFCTAGGVNSNSGANPSVPQVLYKVTTASGVITAIVDIRGAIITQETAF